jgi:hypothetical protein
VWNPRIKPLKEGGGGRGVVPPPSNCLWEVGSEGDGWMIGGILRTHGLVYTNQAHIVIDCDSAISSTVPYVTSDLGVGYDCIFYCSS